MPNITYVGGLISDTYMVHFHEHQTYELVYYTRGKGQVKIGNELVDFEPGTLTLIAPRIPHSDYADGGFQNLHFNVKNPGLPVGRYLVLQDSENQDIYRVIRQMQVEYHLKRRNWEPLVDSFYDVLYQYLVSFSGGEVQNPYVDRIVRDMIVNLSNPDYNLRESIEALPFNAQYFRELFKKNTGLTPIHYLLAKRMEYAKTLIRGRGIHGYPFKEIALLCGYRDPYYFSRQFKLFTGLSPQKWEEQNEDLEISQQKM